MPKQNLDADGLIPEDPQLRLFVTDIEAWPARGDRHSMEHAFFSLRKGVDTTDRRYEHNGAVVEIRPTSAGIPTIWDKDLILFIVANLKQQMNRGVKFDPGARISIDSYNFLLSTSRGDGATQYARLAAAIDRLTGTSYKTSIPSGGKIKDNWWHWLEDVEVIRSPKGRVISFTTRLPSWLMDAVSSGELLRYSRDYFRIPGAIERRMYELCRKHCGNQRQWRISIETFAKKIGARAGNAGASPATIREFRRSIRETLSPGVLPDTWTKDLPDYTVQYLEASGMLVFTNRNPKDTE